MVAYLRIEKFNWHHHFNTLWFRPPPAAQLTLKCIFALQGCTKVGKSWSACAANDRALRRLYLTFVRQHKAIKNWEKETAFSYDRFLFFRGSRREGGCGAKEGIVTWSWIIHQHLTRRIVDFPWVENAPWRSAARLSSPRANVRVCRSVDCPWCARFLPLQRQFDEIDAGKRVEKNNGWPAKEKLSRRAFEWAAGKKIQRHSRH